MMILHLSSVNKQQEQEQNYQPLYKNQPMDYHGRDENCIIRLNINYNVVIVPIA